MAQRQPTADERNAMIDSYLETVVVKFMADNDGWTRADVHKLIAKRAMRRSAQSLQRRAAGSRDHHHHNDAGHTVTKCARALFYS